MTDLRERARCERIRILLRTRNDLYPTPRAKATPYTTAGPAPGRKRKCPACDGSGKTRLRQKCLVCDGLQTIAVDSYVGRVSGQETRKPEPMTPEAREAEIQRLGTSLMVTAGTLDPNESYGWERAIASRNTQGSYRELQHALEHLRSTDHMGWEFITWVYGSGLEVEMSRRSQIRETELVGKLSQWMPSKIRLPHRLHNELMDDKRRRFKELLRCGESLETISDRLLLSVRTLERMKVVT